MRSYSTHDLAARLGEDPPLWPVEKPKSQTSCTFRADQPQLLKSSTRLNVWWSSWGITFWAICPLHVPHARIGDKWNINSLLLWPFLFLYFTSCRNILKNRLSFVSFKGLKKKQWQKSHHNFFNACLLFVWEHRRVELNIPHALRFLFFYAAFHLQMTIHTENWLGINTLAREY